MRLILKLSYRNLIRNKSRNIALGIAIGFGMTILVLSNSFSHGISDTLINKIMVYVSGHIDFSMVEKGKFRSPIIREKDKYIKIIRKNITGIKDLTENLAMFGRVIGNGKSDNIMLIGVERSENEDFTNYFKQLKGNVFDVFSDKYPTPVILSETKAKYLNAKIHDTLRIRLQNVYGQQQTGILTVVAIVKSSNVFMDMAIFTNNNKAKYLMGLKQHETGTIQILLKDPDTAIEQANRLHSLLSPKLAYIDGSISNEDTDIPSVALGFYRNDKSLTLIKKHLKIDTNSIKKSTSKKGVLISKFLANKLHVKLDDAIFMKYQSRYENKLIKNKYTINGIFETKPGILDKNVILLSDALFYKTYNNNLPKNEENLKPSISTTLLPAMGEEWKKLERSKNFDEFKKKIKDFSSLKPQIAALDIRTMHETASNILKMEKALNLITFIAVLIIFFIILIGVVNTLRMTIKERTREIGTVRAIGMRKRDVRHLIVSETILLALFSTIVGTLFAFLIMWITSFFPIQSASMMSILLVNSRLHFVPYVSSIIISMLLILAIAAITAYFPARAAANKQASDALRHYE
jgi:ABC-type lipoprotein release transport system permease subunit